MSFVLVLVLFVAVFFYVMTSLKRKRGAAADFSGSASDPGKPNPACRFHSKKPLTDREQGCYWRLVDNLGGDFVILPQVAFSQFLQVKGGNQKDNFREFARVRQKVADFLICRKDFTIVALIELDDKSHAGKEEKDQERDRVVKESGIRVFRIPSTPGNDAVRNLGDVLRRLDPAMA